MASVPTLSKVLEFLKLDNFKELVEILEFPWDWRGSSPEIQGL